MTTITITDILTSLCSKISAATLSGDIQLANIAAVNDGDEFLTTKSPILLSVINIEDDRTLRNQGLYEKLDKNTMIADRYKKAAQHLVLSLLFSSYNKDPSKYGDGLNKLEQVIRYLQNNTVYYYDTNATEIHEQTETTLPADPDKTLNKLVIDMVSIKLEHLNQVWSFLGGRYMPSVLYTMRLIPIQQDKATIPIGMIKKANIKLWEHDKQEDPAGLLETGEFTNE